MNGTHLRQKSAKGFSQSERTKLYIYIYLFPLLEGCELHRIDRETWPGMKRVWVKTL